MILIDIYDFYTSIQVYRYTIPYFKLTLFSHDSTRTL